jgi:LemA protein
MSWIIIAIIVIVVALLVLFAIAQFNKLRRLDQLCIGAFADIDTLLAQRADLIPNLVETVSGAKEFESSTLQAVTKARTASMNAQDVNEKAQADNALTSALGKLFAVAEAYPQLTATANFAQLQTQLAEIETKLQFARQFYNDTVVQLNTALRTIPSMWFAGLAKVGQRPVYEEVDQARRSAPKVDFTS